MKYILKFGSFLLYFEVDFTSLLSPPPTSDRRELAMKIFPVEMRPPHQHPRLFLLDWTVP